MVQPYLASRNTIEKLYLDRYERHAGRSRLHRLCLQHVWSRFLRSLSTRDESSHFDSVTFHFLSTWPMLSVYSSSPWHGPGPGSPRKQTLNFCPKCFQAETSGVFAAAVWHAPDLPVVATLATQQGSGVAAAAEAVARLAKQQRYTSREVLKAVAIEEKMSATVAAAGAPRQITPPAAAATPVAAAVAAVAAAAPAPVTAATTTPTATARPA